MKNQTTELTSTKKSFGTTQEVFHAYVHCNLCGSKLHCSHITDFVKNLIEETAKCPECGLLARQGLHRLQ